MLQTANPEGNLILVKVNRLICGKHDFLEEHLHIIVFFDPFSSLELFEFCWCFECCNGKFIIKFLYYNNIYDKLY